MLMRRNQAAAARAITPTAAAANALPSNSINIKEDKPANSDIYIENNK